MVARYAACRNGLNNGITANPKRSPTCSDDRSENLIFGSMSDHGSTRLSFDPAIAPFTNPPMVPAARSTTSPTLYAVLHAASEIPGRAAVRLALSAVCSRSALAFAYACSSSDNGGDVSRHRHLAPCSSPHFRWVLAWDTWWIFRR